ncbi:MAG TPA: dienelactone hydrolase family protein [Steroidobacteraceae bacterium]|nr:dienelactone hydrolase family protein [Steroidobacteraceae bacterium]
MHVTRLYVGLALLISAGLSNSALAQINTDIVERNRDGFHRQATDPGMKRDQGTLPVDWPYELAPGVRTRIVTFYVDGGTALHGKLFLPKGFSTKQKWPAVVVGHGINAVSIGIEKFAARFAERGLVAMAIDYRSYGYSVSGSDSIRLLEADPSTDRNAASTQELRVLMKRTNLNNVHEVQDFRAAISYLQGEPGVDADRIGIWGTSNGGAVVTAVSGLDGRVKAAVVQVITPRPAAPRAVAPTANNQEDAIRRVQSGQGNEIDGGFSFKSKVDQWYLTRNQDVQPGALLERIPNTNHLLFLPAEKDELTRGPAGAIEAAKFLNERGVTAQAIVLPELTHFQAYSFTGFEVGSTLAADWFVKYLGVAR